MQGKKSLPIVIIVAGVVLAAGAAFLLRRSDADTPPKIEDRVVDTGAGGHLRGAPDARVTLVEYGDFQCPSCGYYFPIVESLLEGAPDLVKLEFHHFPLIQVHPNALPAALAAEAAAEQGKFWEMHDLLFQSQTAWSAKPSAEEDFVVMAQRLGLDSEKFKQSMKSDETRARVLKDVERGRAAQVEGTPSFFINGRPVHPLPQSVQAFKQIVEEGVASK
ncbi:MAG TPA: thioredoxin domain-containing protein [Terriglobia bacterium]|nr:thioredoxin domain-containing protein [Terriglobia bacterium]